MKSIDLIRTLVEKELREYEGDSNMVPLVPHRASGSDTADEPHEPTKTDRLYELAVTARLATEALVKALDNPIYDGAYEHAFKATMSLREALNALIAVGAEPEEKDHIVAPPPDEQPGGDSGGFVPMTYSGGSAV